MKRTDLVARLELVSPALAGNDILPITTHLWFKDDRVTAYNGHVAISAPCAIGFEGAVPGAMLLNLLKASPAKEVTFEGGKKELSIKAASSRFHLATMPSSDFADVFQMPPRPDETRALDAKAKDFIACLSSCMRSVSTDTSIPDQLGITLMPGNGHLAFYASNGVTLSRAELRLKKGDTQFPRRAILPSLFCKQVLALSDGKPIRLDVTKKHAMFAAPGNVSLFGSLVVSEQPLPYDQTFNHLHPADEDDRMVPIVPKLARILERACIVASDNTRTWITVEDDRAKFATESAMGHRVYDTLELPKGHPKVTLDIEPKWVRLGCEDFDRMLITRRAFIMANDTAYYLVSGKGS
jgi:DNA polymerase-3 subunit beta